jgi:hypothetical protein
MIRWFRERPLFMFAIGAGGAAILGVGFVSAAVVNAGGVVLPGVALLMAGLAFYLMMLGLISEVVLYGSRDLASPWDAARGTHYNE